MTEHASGPPAPETIYHGAEREGRRRLDMPTLEKVATGFIAGVTIVFGVVALGVLTALVEPRLGRELGELAGAAGFGIGLVLLVVGRTELFSENLFGPVAAALKERAGAGWLRLGWLWLTILALNLVGGAVLTGVLLVDGALPDGSAEVLDRVAEEIAEKSPAATLARAVLAGALLALLSYLLHAVDTATARIMVTFTVGFFLAVGPFDHVVVSVLHLLFGLWHSGVVGVGDVLANLGLSTAGNLVGGLLLITFTHSAQVKGR